MLMVNGVVDLVVCLGSYMHRECHNGKKLVRKPLQCADSCHLTHYSVAFWL